MWSEQGKTRELISNGNLKARKRAAITFRDQSKILQPHLSSSLKCITKQVCIGFYVPSFSYQCICQENSFQKQKKKKGRKIGSAFLGEKNLSTFKCFILQNEIQASESELKNYKSEQKENMPPSFEDTISYQDGEKVRCLCWWRSRTPL